MDTVLSAESSTTAFSEGGRICLYLLTIADYCRDENIPFADEVRTTYLHELGHHLGWDEDDLEARNL